MRSAGVLATAVVLCAFLGGCGSGTGDPHDPSGPVPVALTRAELFMEGDPPSPVDDGGFAMPADATPPDGRFEGRLELVGPERHGSFRGVYEQYPLGDSDSTWKHLPPFSLEFVQDGNDLIPARQGLIHTGHPNWNYIVGPGHVWTRPDDGGYFRASIPFALVQVNQNCVHNGVMLFLFNGSLSPAISKVRYQVTQETCAYQKLDLWGQISARYTPQPVTDAAAIIANHRAETANRIPTRPLSALATDYPGSGIDPVAMIAEFRYPQDITYYGLVVNGVNYVSGCPTRHGEYAFCGQMRVPSYSTAKSVFNGIAMMRLGQLYGAGVYSQRIRDYVPEYTRGGNWEDVTFDNALDMATGNFISASYMADEDGPESSAFFQAVSYSTKIDAAFAPFPQRAVPGTVWVYQSAASFITTQGMNGYLRAQRSSSADLFNMVRDEVYEPIHLTQGSLTTLRTDNSAQGRPFGYMGLFYVPDDVAKLAQLLNNHGGKADGNQLLDPRRLEESLFHDPLSLGLPVPDTGSTYRYSNGFWARHFTPGEFPEYGCDFWVPYMSGWGGITISLLPNGASFYVFSDHHEYSWNHAVNEANKLAPLCPTARQ